MKRTLKSIEPVQCGKVSAAIYGLMSLIFVPFFAFFPIIASFAPKTAESPPPLVLVGIGIAMTIGMPILYAVMGFIMGVIGAWFYNVIAKWIGGIQVEVE
jgi:uncharacterized membrane protein (DUF485 family)